MKTGKWHYYINYKLYFAMVAATQIYKQTLYRLVNFRLDLFRSVGKIDRWRYVTSAHFTLCSVQRRDKRRVNERRLQKSQTRCDVPRHPEVRILVNRTRDQTRNIRTATKYLHWHHNSITPPYGPYKCNTNHKLFLYRHSSCSSSSWGELFNKKA